MDIICSSLDTESFALKSIKIIIKLKWSEDQLTIDDLTNAMIDEQGFRGEQLAAVCTTNHLLVRVPLHVSFELENVRQFSLATVPMTSDFFLRRVTSPCWESSMVVDLQVIPDVVGEFSEL